MSTERGGKAWAQRAIEDASGGLDTPPVAEQFDFLPSPEEMQVAQRILDQDRRSSAKQSEVLAEARRRGGRKPGSRNRRTDDLARFLLSHGQHPAVTLMKIQSTPPEILVERSAAMDPVKKRLSYGEAVSLTARCADILLPYMEGKKPIAVDLSAKGDFNLLIPGVNISHDDARLAADGEFVIDGQVQYLPEGGSDD